MAPNDVYVFCNECSDVHQMRIRVELSDGPTRNASIGDVYRGRELPSNAVTLINNRVLAPAFVD